MRALHPVEGADPVDGGIEGGNVLSLYHRQKIEDTRDRMKRAQFWHALQRRDHAAGGLGRHHDGHVRPHHAARDLFGKAQGIAGDHPTAFQALDPGLHGGAGEPEPSRRLRMADPGILPQERNQGTIGGVEHHCDQSKWQYAENYPSFRQLVHGVLHGFAVF